MKMLFVYLVDAVAMIGSVFLGIFSDVGLCAYYWTPAIFEGGLTSNPDWTNAASVISVILLPLTIYLCGMGAFLGIVLPLHLVTGVPLSRSRVFAAVLRQLVGKVGLYIESQPPSDAAADQTGKGATLPS